MLSTVRRAWKDGLIRGWRETRSPRQSAEKPSGSAPSGMEPRAAAETSGDAGSRIEASTDSEAASRAAEPFGDGTRFPTHPSTDSTVALGAAEPPGDRAGSLAAGWLRIVEEDGGAGVRAALLLTSGGGAPVGFCFTRRGRKEPLAPPPRALAPCDFAALAGSLLRAVVPPPALVIGLAGEAAGVLPEVAAAGLPCGCIEPAGADRDGRGGARGSGDVDWQREPNKGSAARRLFDEFSRRADPFEPLDRARRGLAEAFADRRVEDLTTEEGLTTVVALSAPSPRVERPGADGGRAFRSTGLAERLWALLARPLDGPGLDETALLDWPEPLMPFQREGVGALLVSDRLLLADDMGLGKTVQTIAAVRILFANKTITSCLVAAPASLLDQWRREIGRWAPELSAIVIRGSAADRDWQWAARVDVTVVSYDTLRADVVGGARARARLNWDVVVADEAQRIKNRNDTSAALKGLRRARSWALTGTPIENHEEELASILEFVDHDDSGPPRSYQPGTALRARHRELQLRRRKGDVLDDLPPKQVTRVPISLSPRQRVSYDRAERDGVIYLRSLGAEVGVRHVLELITRLKQICNADPQTGESSKLEDVKERLAQLTAQGHRALVFSQYTSEASGVGAAVRHLREFNPLSFTGELAQDERASIVDRFCHDEAHKVLVLSLRAGGLGLNLQEASYVFHLDRWWNPAVERQAEDRIHRIGQTVKVNVITYSCAGTIEERIDGILAQKQGLFDELVDGVSLDLSTRLNREELLGVFGLE